MTLHFALKACFAGSLLGAVDVVNSLMLGGSAMGALSLWILASAAGLGLGLAMGLFLWLGDRLSNAVPAQLPRSLFDGLLAAVPAVALGIELFSGKGVSGTTLGTVGPYIFPLATAVGVAFASAGIRRLLEVLPSRPAGVRYTVGLAVLLAGAALIWVDRNFFPGLYDYLHILLVVATLYVWTAAVFFIRPEPFFHPETARLRGSVIAGVVLLLSVPVLVGYPSKNVDRVLMIEEALAGSRMASVVWAVVDMDGDGSSPLLGGGDCDDFSAEIGPSRAEDPGNGVDEDCDGLDEILLHPSFRATYKMDSAKVQEVVAKAQKYPTVVLLIDALRHDRVPDGRFPNLARIAGDGISFSRAYATSSSTASSLPAMVTGVLRPRTVDLNFAERLAKGGKTSAMVVLDVVLDTIEGKVNTWGNLHYPFRRGFSRVEIVATPQKKKGWGGGVRHFTGTEITDRVFELLDSSEPPDLIWAHYFDVHQWNMLKLDGPKLKGAKAYDAILEKLDAEIGRILNRAEGLNLVLVSDHGECIGDHGKRFHTKYLYRELVQVPLVFRIPGQAPYIVESPVSLTSLSHTLVAMAGVPLPEAQASQNLLGLAGNAEPGVGPPIAMFDKVHWGLVQDEWRLIYTPKSGAKQLFHVVDDPEETENLADAKPEQTEDMMQMLKAVRAATERYRTSDLRQARTQAQEKKAKARAKAKKKEKKKKKAKKKPASKITTPRSTDGESK